MAPSLQRTDLSLIQKGSLDDHVRLCQKDLYLLGYMPENGIDGIFGVGTEVAIKEFQRENGTLDDGKVGQITWELLGKAISSIPEVGDTTSLVHAASKYLVSRGLLPAAQTMLDEKMVLAIKQFQSVNGLIANGMLNPRTLAKLTQGIIATEPVAGSTAPIANVSKEAIVKRNMMVWVGIISGIGLLAYLMLNKKKAKD